MCACSNQTGQCGLSLSHLSFFLAFSSSLLWPVSLTMCVVAQVGSIFIIRSFFLLRSAFPAPSSFYWADVRACPASLLWLMMHDRCTRSTSPLALGACVCVCVCVYASVCGYVCMYVCMCIACVYSICICPPSLPVSPHGSIPVCLVYLHPVESVVYQVTK